MSNEEKTLTIQMKNDEDDKKQGEEGEELESKAEWGWISWKKEEFH